MSILRVKVAGEWVKELVQKGVISLQECERVLDCLQNKKDIGPLIVLSRMTGDATPLEILAAGLLNGDDRYSYSGRPCSG